MATLQPALPKHWVLWDGDCAFCRRAVNWAKERVDGSAFEFLPYQQAPSPPMTPELREACGKAVHVLTREGNVLRGGAAAMFVLERAGHPHFAHAFQNPALAWSAELGYRLVANNRSAFSKLLMARK